MENKSKGIVPEFNLTVRNSLSGLFLFYLLSFVSLDDWIKAKENTHPTLIGCKNGCKFHNKLTIKVICTPDGNRTHIVRTGI